MKGGDPRKPQPRNAAELARTWGKATAQLGERDRLASRVEFLDHSGEARPDARELPKPALVDERR